MSFSTPSSLPFVSSSVPLPQPPACLCPPSPVASLPKIACNSGTSSVTFPPTACIISKSIIVRLRGWCIENITLAGVDTNGLYTHESLNCFSKLPFYMQLFCDRCLAPLCAERVALGFADDQYVPWGVLLVHGEEEMERIWHRLDTVEIVLYKYLALNCIVVSFRAGWVSVILTDLMNLRSIALHKCRRWPSQTALYTTLSGLYILTSFSRSSVLWFHWS